VQDGKLLPAAARGEARGVIFDIGHGGGSFDYTIAEAAIAQGCRRTPISSTSTFFRQHPGHAVPSVVMSKLVGLGFSLPDVVAMATTAPARVIARLPKHGTLQVGRTGRSVDPRCGRGPVEFVDTRNNKRTGRMHLRPSGAVVAGVAFGRPYQSPFGVR
jgi:dihydroorotase